MSSSWWGSLFSCIRLFLQPRWSVVCFLRKLKHMDNELHILTSTLKSLEISESKVRLLFLQSRSGNRPDQTNPIPWKQMLQEDACHVIQRTQNERVCVAIGQYRILARRQQLVLPKCQAKLSWFGHVCRHNMMDRTVVVALQHRRQKSMGDHHIRGVCRSSKRLQNSCLCCWIL